MGANFKLAYDRYIKPAEGGYVNDPADKGGETYGGIARKFYPNWDGWIVIDFEKKRRTLKRGEKLPGMDGKVEAFYFDMWNKNLFNQIQDQNVAAITFDWFVNSGGAALYVKYNSGEEFGIQKVLNQLGKKVATDRRMGAQTVAAINSTDSTRLNNAIKTDRINFYNFLVKRDPSQAKFQTGWLARINSFPTLAVAGGGIAIILLAVGLFFLVRNKKQKRNK
jgi:lysozyme family protein